MLKVKYIYKYPISAPVDRLKMQIQRDRIEPDTIAKLETITEEISVKRYADLTEKKWVVETEDLVEFYSASAMQKDIPRDGLVFEALFFEGAGTTLHDTSGQENHGTIYGMTWETLSTSKIVGSFDGVDDYVKVPDDPSLNVESTQEITIVVWCMVKTLDAQFIVRKGYGSSNAYALLIDRYSKLRFDYYNTDSAKDGIITGSQPETNKWSMFAAVVTQTELLLYINDKLDASTSKTVQLKDYPENVQISGWQDVGKYFNGPIGSVHIYNRALTESEIKEIYELEAPLFGITL